MARRCFEEVCRFSLWRNQCTQVSMSQNIFFFVTGKLECLLLAFFSGRVQFFMNRLFWKNLPGTNTLAYFGQPSVTKKWSLKCWHQEHQEGHLQDWHGRLPKVFVSYQQIDRQAGRQAGRQTERQTERQTDRRTGRQADRQTGRQADRQTGRQVDM